MKITSRKVEPTDPLERAGFNLDETYRQLKERWKPWLGPGEELYLEVLCKGRERRIRCGIYSSGVFHLKQEVVESMG